MLPATPFSIGEMYGKHAIHRANVPLSSWLEEGKLGGALTRRDATVKQEHDASTWPPRDAMQPPTLIAALP